MNVYVRYNRGVNFWSFSSDLDRNFTPISRGGEPLHCKLLPTEALKDNVRERFGLEPDRYGVLMTSPAPAPEDSH